MWLCVGLLRKSKLADASANLKKLRPFVVPPMRKPIIKKYRNGLLGA